MTNIRLVVSDVDGTLVTSDKRLTPASVAAIEALRKRGIQFTITSSRPSFGLRALIAPLQLELPIGPFNGSALINPDMSVVEQHVIPEAAARQSLALLARNGIDAWIFTCNEWIIHRDDGRYVAHERKTIQTDPRLVTDDAPYLDKACKIVGVSKDFALLARCEAELQTELGAKAHAVRSQNYYLDVTPPGVNKGTFVATMGTRLGIPLSQIATIGDMQNDVPMFQTSGLSFAMGNASDAVKTHATHVTATNETDGFAKAMEQLLQTSG
jgi:Cof subfamily protein (haloacid dehalogenase superfamily)